MVSSIIVFIFLKSNILYIKDNIKLYNAATPAPSVAVNTPFTIPPIVMTIKSKLGIALHVIINLSLKDICSLTTLVLFFIDVRAHINIIPTPIKIPGI